MRKPHSLPHSLPHSMDNRDCALPHSPRIHLASRPGQYGGILESGGIAKDTMVSAQATLNSTFTSTFMSVIIDIQVTFNWTSNRDAWRAIMIVLEIVQTVQLSLKSTFNSTMTAHSRVHFSTLIALSVMQLSVICNQNYPGLIAILSVS